MQSKARIQSADTQSASTPATITKDAIRSYLEYLSSKGRTRETVAVYSSRLRSLWEFLPQEKLVYPDTLGKWQVALLEHGYSAATVNIHLSAANGLLDHMGRRDLQLAVRLKEDKEVQPELTRREYKRLLQAAKVMGRERTYMIVKTIALTGVQTVDLPKVTVEKVKDGWLQVSSEGRRQNVPIPKCLREELADYIGRQGIRTGPIFLTRNGKSLQRTQVTANIQSLSQTARVDENKCNPRCLRKLYQVTQAEIERTVRVLAIQSYEQMLDTEQMTVGWNDMTQYRLAD